MSRSRTWTPASARQTAVTSPTYPAPTMQSGSGRSLTGGLVVRATWRTIRVAAPAATRSEIQTGAPAASRRRFRFLGAPRARPPRSRCPMRRASPRTSPGSGAAPRAALASRLQSGGKARARRTRRLRQEQGGAPPRHGIAAITGRPATSAGATRWYGRITPGLARATRTFPRPYRKYWRASSFSPSRTW